MSRERILTHGLDEAGQIIRSWVKYECIVFIFVIIWYQYQCFISVFSRCRVSYDNVYENQYLLCIQQHKAQSPRVNGVDFLS